MTEQIESELTLLRDHPNQLVYSDVVEAWRDRLGEHRILPEGDYGEMHPILRVKGVDCFPRQDLVAITGKAKCGKTLAISIFMASALWGGEIIGVEPTQGLLKVLYVDTEQAMYSTQKVLQRVVKMSTLPYQEERFSVLNLRRERFEDRLSLFITAIHEMRPDLVILDGVRDLLLDFNSIEESVALINRLMSLALDFDCCIVCVLHQNKPKDDNNMRGHLGTELENKAAEVYEMLREENIFKLVQRVTRNSPVLNPILFEVRTDADGIALPTEYQDYGKDDMSTSDPSCPATEMSQSLAPLTLQEILDIAFEEEPIQHFHQLISRIWAVCKPRGQNGQTAWRTAKKLGYVSNMGSDRWYRTNVKETPENSEDTLF